MRKVALLMLLSFLANAEQRRSLSSITCDVPCQPDEFKEDPLVVLCGGGRCTTTVTLRKGKMLNVISLPVGTKGVELEMSANDDMDINLHDATDGTCIAGAQCDGATFEAVEGCSSVSDYCLPYQGMSWYFSGDAEDDPVVETLRLSPEGNVTVPLEVSLQAASASQAQVSATNGPFEDCPAQLPGCRSCSEYTGCSLIETPMCDGSATVVCSAPTTTSSTGTSLTTTSTTLSTTTVTSTSISVTTTSSNTKTSTTKSSTISISSTTRSSTGTTFTKSTTTSISITRSSTSTSLTSQTSTSTSTLETETSSTTTSLTSSSTTRSFTLTTTSTQSQTSSTSGTNTWTSTSTITTSRTSFTSTITTSTSITTSETTLTKTSTTSLTSTRSTVTTSSTSQTSSRTSVTSTSTGTRTSVTITSSITATTTQSSTRTSVTSTSSSISSTSFTQSTSITSLTSSSITATTSSTSLTMTTTSLTETTSSSSLTSSSSSVTTTETCGCCSSCLGWAMMIGCGSFEVCQRQLEECQAASLTCQGNLNGYQIGLEECKNREAFLDATIASLTAQLSSHTNCTSFAAEDDADAAVWVLVVLVIILILALILLLILSWRLRNKHQATKEQLAHCQDELFTRPSKQDERPDLQRQMRKLQRELEDAKQKLAAKAALELKLQQMQEQLGKEDENVRRGQELWKLNRSMYTILRQVVQDSRDFAQGVREAGEKAPAFKQRIEQFETKLAISSGRRDAAEAELAMLKNEATGRAQPSEVDTTCDSESPISISTGNGRRAKSKESHAAAPPGEVPLESPRLVVQVEASEAPDPPKVEMPTFTAVAPTAPVVPSASTTFAPTERVLKRALTRQESKIEQVLAQRLDVTPGSLREGLRQVGQQAKERTTVLERVLSKRLDEAKVQPNESNGEIPVEPMTSQGSQ